MRVFWCELFKSSKWLVHGIIQRDFEALTSGRATVVKVKKDCGILAGGVKKFISDMADTGLVSIHKCVHWYSPTQITSQYRDVK